MFVRLDQAPRRLKSPNGADGILEVNALRLECFDNLFRSLAFACQSRNLDLTRFLRFGLAGCVLRCDGALAVGVGPALSARLSVEQEGVSYVGRVILLKHTSCEAPRRRDIY